MDLVNLSSLLREWEHEEGESKKKRIQNGGMEFDYNAKKWKFDYMQKKKKRSVVLSGKEDVKIFKEVC